MMLQHKPVAARTWPRRSTVGARKLFGTQMGTHPSHPLELSRFFATKYSLAQGRPDALRCPVCSCARFVCAIARETAGAARTRSSLRPLFLRRENEMQTSGAMRRENAKSHSVVVTRLVRSHWAGDPVFQRRAVIEPISRGVLDRPVKPDDDSRGCCMPRSHPMHPAPPPAPHHDRHQHHHEARPRSPRS